jgi:hypothetical protein
MIVFINLRKDVTIPTHVTALHISFIQGKVSCEIASMKFKITKLSFLRDDRYLLCRIQYQKNL